MNKKYNVLANRFPIYTKRKLTSQHFNDTSTVYAYSLSTISQFLQGNVSIQAITIYEYEQLYKDAKDYEDTYVLYKQTLL